MHSFSGISANIAINHILLKTRFFALHLRCRHYGSVFNNFDVISPKGTEFGRISQNNGHYDRSRSLKVTDFGTIRQIVCEFSLVWA